MVANNRRIDGQSKKGYKGEKGRIENNSSIEEFQRIDLKVSSLDDIFEGKVRRGIALEGSLLIDPSRG